ncbi:uncharacterized protein LOC113856146 [Abrus precatorius]|uniref:Uncharacterized protein LOC113856146 n=1 Tax=Abrus precatorius TaxID=3816 RepID=A0A8B8KIN0_ABRPR|nr:uncharacterized protein LOC113856146 [Abrus precatorius]XP_027343636.1 uncharacterized protein LOC113856146 [Abrus precatorius]XP_027343637.1 uncharacterized protein LOC113856146 [Abrus precatorius]
MAIEKNNFKVLRPDSECSPRSGETMSSDEEELRGRNSAVESDDDDEFDDADSGAGSDDFDLLELGETGAEFCRIGNQTCSIPLELYDLAGLEDILSVDVWNECLSEEERFELAKYLPDLDQENFVQTLQALFTGGNLHFGSPIKKLFDMLKGGLCEPRVALYREGLNFFQKRQHYHLLRKHQNNMVSNLCQIRDAWRNCRGYSIEERLRVLNIMRSQKSLMYEKMEDLEADSSDEESGEGVWSRKSKDRKIAQKMGRYPFHGVGSGLEFPPRGRSVVMEQEQYGKQNPKGILKLAGSKTPSVKDPTGRSSSYHASDMNPGLNGSARALSQQKKSVGYDSGSMLRLRDQLWNGDNDEEMSYRLSVQDHNLPRSNLVDKSGVRRLGKRHDRLRGDGTDTDNLTGLSLSSKTDLHGYSRNSNQSSDMKMFTTKPSSKRGSYEFPRKVRHPENVQQFLGSDQVKSRLRGSQLPLKVNTVDSADCDELFYSNETPGQEFGMDSSRRYDDWNLKGKKWKAGRESPDLSYTAYRSSSPQVSERFLSSDFRAKSLQEKIRGPFMKNGGKDTMALRSNQMLLRSEETESDSSEQLDDDEDNNPLFQSKYPYLMGTATGSRTKSLKSYLDPKKDKFVTDFKSRVLTQSKKKGSFAEQGRKHGVENYLSKAKQKGEIRNGGPLHNQAGKFIEESYPSGSDMLNAGDDDWKQVYKKGRKNGQIREHIERLDMPSSNAYTAERKKKGRTGLDHSIMRSKYLHEYTGDEDDSLERQLLVDDNEVGQSRYGRKGQIYATYKGDQNDRSEASLLGCNSIMKKRKMKDDAADLGGRDEDVNLLLNTQTDDSTYVKRKSKKKTDVGMINSEKKNSELHVTDMGTADIELETKPQKKTFTLITPTVHTGFSFSIIHLLSAVRIAMISPLAEDGLELGKPREEQNKVQEGGGVNGALSNHKMPANCEPADQVNMPSLTVQEIVNHVKSNPGDPFILETQEPLQDLVRGVLKLFSSKTAPLGAKGWKVLAVYEKTSRSWSWTGPVNHNSSDHDNVEEVTSPEAWGLPRKMLVKLVDSFANWLKCGQETLQQIGSLPAPPLSSMQVNLDEKERFRDLRAQKSLNTISPSSEEVRAYFRKEEVLRYSIPDRAFSYTAADGKKSIVAPLRRCGGKPTSKARDHFMLKRDRPPHVTILCLVRDAAARLPGSIGTRADVCTLIRDSQYIVEDVSDAQINQVVSGALDRLHYERDPCVQFDGERKLWVYLHREREEEDFEDDGTSSTKKWKRQKKDATDPSDQGTVTVACHGTGEQSGYDLCSDLNVDPPCIDDDKGIELLSTDTRLNAEDNVDVNRSSEEGNVCDGNSMAWEALGVNRTRELCQENSTNEDFDDESFGRERPVEILSASLL